MLVRLPNQTIRNMALEDAILKRRSIRSFKERSLTQEELGQLLWAGQGNVEGLRTAPSAGASFPMELYVVDATGIHRYTTTYHALETLTESDVRKALSDASLGQECVLKAAANIAICAVRRRIEPRYHERSERYIYMESGHIAQNIHLQAVSLGLGSVAVGAFNDEEVQKVLQLPEGTDIIYMVAVGAV